MGLSLEAGSRDTGSSSRCHSASRAPWMHRGWLPSLVSVVGKGFRSEVTLTLSDMGKRVRAQGNPSKWSVVGGSRRAKGTVNVYDLGSLYHYLTTDRSHSALDLDNKKGRHFLRKPLGTPSAPSASASITLSQLFTPRWPSFIQSVLIDHLLWKKTIPVPSAHENGGDN